MFIIWIILGFLLGIAVNSALWAWWLIWTLQKGLTEPVYIDVAKKKYVITVIEE